MGQVTSRLLLILPLCFALPLHAQSTQDAPAQPLVLKTESRAVVVDVVVARGNGKPVRGLQKQDFEVFEDGQPQSVNFFEDHTAAAPSATTSQQLPPMPPGTQTNLPPASESAAVNVLLLDYLNTEPQDQTYVHRQIMDFLHKVKPGTRMAIFLLGSKLRFVQGFTADTSELLAALNNKHNGTAPKKEAVFQSRSDIASGESQIAHLQMMQHSPAGIEAIRAAQADLRAFDYGARASMTFEALNDLARYLAGVPGRKNLIWFASSFPVVFFPSTTQRNRFHDDPAMREYLVRDRNTADLLTGSRVAIYPVGAQGVMNEHVMEANNAGPGAEEGAGRGGSLAPYSQEAGQRAGLISSMEQLAADTGGHAFYNTNNINGAIQQAIDDGANYYTLSYSPTDKKTDGQYRRIEIRVRGGHYKLAYRQGYNADAMPSLETKGPTDPLAPVLKYGLPNATGVLFGVRATPARRQPPDYAARAGENSSLKEPFTRYDIRFYIRATDVAFQRAANGGRSGRIQVGILAFDADGVAVNWTSGEQQMDITEARYAALQKEGIPARVQIDLPDKDVSLLTGVYDWDSGRAGSLRIALHPGAQPIAAESDVAAAPEPAPTHPLPEPAQQIQPVEPAKAPTPRLSRSTQVSVEQLQQILTADQAAHRSDKSIAERIASLRLTERLSAPALEHISDQLHPGKRTAEALDILADSSALLPPPSSAYLDVPRPDMAAQRDIYRAAINYVANSLPHLPDFIATRTTRSFNNSPLVVGHSGFAPATDEHLVGTFNRQITYSDGKEVLEPETGSKSKSARPAGLDTWGEFGPALAVVLTDSLKGRVTWSRWEQTSSGRAAVFHYDVPRNASHFVVNYCCSWKNLNSRNQSAPVSFRGTPGYRGDLFIDPVSGAILRVTVDAELDDSDPITRASIAVQYGKVDIGGKTYICPMRSVAISADRDRPGTAYAGQDNEVIRLNETTFVNYHHFGSTTRILPASP